MSTASVAIIVGALLIAFLAVLIALPNSVAEAMLRLKTVRLGKVFAVDLWDRATVQREGHEPDRKALEATVAKIGSGRILWIDDAPANNLLETQALRLLGVEVDVATTNNEAEEYLLGARYDLVLSDIGRDSVTEKGDLGLAVPELMRRAGSDADLAYYVGKRTAAETPGGDPVFDRPSELLPHVVAVLGASKTEAKP